MELRPIGIRPRSAREQGATKKELVTYLPGFTYHHGHRIPGIAVGTEPCNWGSVPIRHDGFNGEPRCFSVWYAFCVEAERRREGM